jgi:methylglyoxal synthase
MPAAATREDMHDTTRASRTLALIAHDNKKVDLVAWATYNRGTLQDFALLATRHTARLLRDKVGLDVESLLSGPEGGDAQIAARAATGSVHNLPLATNLATADLIIAALAPPPSCDPGREVESPAAG